MGEGKFGAGGGLKLITAQLCKGFLLLYYYAGHAMRYTHIKKKKKTKRHYRAEEWEISQR